LLSNAALQLYASHCHVMLPLQLAGSTTHVVFVVGANAKQSKKEIKSSAE